MKVQKKNIVIIVSIIILVLIDQIIKFNINDIVINSGGAFGFGQNSIITFIVINIIVLGIIIKFMITQKKLIDNKTLIFLCLILGGGFSNLIDRFFRGGVVDYININKWINFPYFNLADVFIVIGWISLAFFVFKYNLKDLRYLKK